MKTIWKYSLTITDEQVIVMPTGSKILSIGNHRGSLCLWAMVEDASTESSVVKCIEIHGTGNPIEPATADRRFVGTAIIDPFVWHVFERISNSD